MGIKNKIIKNTMVNVVFTLLAALVSFFLLGYMVRELGAEEYGLIGLCTIFSLAGYIQILDLGLQTAIIKYVAEYNNKGETEKICKLINSTLFLLFVLSLPAILFGLVLLDPLSHSWLHVPIIYQESFKHALMLIFLSYFFEFPNVVFSGVLEGLQRYDILKGMHFVYTVFFALVAIVLLYTGHGYLSIIFAMMLSSFLRFVVYTIYVFKLLPYLKIRRSFFSSEVLREIKSMTKYVFVGKISGFIHGRSDKILIGIFLTPVFMTAYELINKLPQLLKTLMGFGYAAVMPAASEVQSLNDYGMINKLFLKGWRFNLFFYFPIITGALVLAKPFLVVWVGSEYSYLSIYLQFFIAQHFFLLMVSYANSMLYGMNARLRAMTTITIFGTMIKLVSVLLLIVNYKLWSFVVGLMLSMMIPLPFGIKIILKEFQLKFYDFFKEIFQVGIVMIVPLVLSHFLSSLLPPQSFWTLLLHGGIWCVVYWGILYLLVLDREIKDLIHELMRKMLPTKNSVQRTRN